MTTLFGKEKELRELPPPPSASELAALRAKVADQGARVKDAKAVRPPRWGGLLVAGVRLLRSRRLRMTRFAAARCSVAAAWHVVDAPMQHMPPPPPPSPQAAAAAKDDKQLAAAAKAEVDTLLALKKELDATEAAALYQVSRPPMGGNQCLSTTHPVGLGGARGQAEGGRQHRTRLGWGAGRSFAARVTAGARSARGWLALCAAAAGRGCRAA